MSQDIDYLILAAYGDLLDRSRRVGADELLRQSIATLDVISRDAMRMGSHSLYH